jgi:hypothetical protein
VAKHVQLSNAEHKELRVTRERSAQLGDNVPQEFKAVQAHYPIYFNKDSQTGKFYPAALFGFQSDENLFLREGKWAAQYIPMSVERVPFLVGQVPYVEDGNQKIRRVIHIDMESPRISEKAGEKLYQGLSDVDQFVNALLEYNLLESFVMTVTLNDGSKHEMVGFYTINEDSLTSLPDDAIVALHKAGYLARIYEVIASQAHVSTLVSLKNQQMGLVSSPEVKL